MRENRDHIIKILSCYDWKEDYEKMKAKFPQRLGEYNFLEPADQARFLNLCRKQGLDDEPFYTFISMLYYNKLRIDQIALHENPDSPISRPYVKVIKAIKARIVGEYDNPELMQMGYLSPNQEEDILTFIKSVHID